MAKYIVGIIGISGLMVGWMLVQQVWRRAFSDQITDDDVLAGRSDCGSCGCTSPCIAKKFKKSKNNE